MVPRNSIRWFTESRHVDIETGEALTKSQVERENWTKIGSSQTIQDCGSYKLKIHTHEYRRNNQLRLF